MKDNILFKAYLKFSILGIIASCDLDNDKYTVPTLEELGLNEQDCGPHLYPGGETEALLTLDKSLKKTVCDSHYHFHSFLFCNGFQAVTIL